MTKNSVKGNENISIILQIKFEITTLAYKNDIT